MNHQYNPNGRRQTGTARATEEEGDALVEVDRRVDDGPRGGAEALDVTRTHLDRVCRGDRRPSLKLALAIEKLSGGVVATASWAEVPAHSRD